MTYLERSYVEELRDRFANFELAKTEALDIARRLVKNSKLIIYSLNRSDLSKANLYREENAKLLAELNSKVSEYPELRTSVGFGFQEYAEAEIYASYLLERIIPTHYQLNVDHYSYLMGLMDFCGELLRHVTAKLLTTSEDTALRELSETAKLFDSLYEAMLEISPQSYELRKKIDYLVHLRDKVLDMGFRIRYNTGMRGDGSELIHS